MIFTLEALPAKEGDCLLLHWGDKNDPKLAVVDGGPGRVYEESLLPRLKAIRQKRGVAPLVLDLVMVSHADSDHVVGIQKLFRALKKDVDANIPVAQRDLKARRLWHNTFNDVLGDGVDAYYDKMPKKFQAAIGGKPPPELVDALAKAVEKATHEAPDEAAEDAREIALLLAGHGEARDLRISHKFLLDKGLMPALNAPFKGKQGKATLITAEKAAAPQVVDGVEWRIVGPAATEIAELQKEFDKYIKDKHLTVEAMLAAYADKSAKNLSSIACLASLGGKTILFTGDARGDKVRDGLKAAGLLKQNKPLKVDVLKAPHHGSDRNVEQDFFEKIVADAYVFSGDGKNGNPERDTLRMLRDARGKDAVYDVHLTYPVDETDKERQADRKRKKKPWNAAKDSLATFFAESKAAGFRFRLHAGERIKIELGDDVIAW